MKASTLFRIAVLLGFLVGIFAINGCENQNPVSPTKSDTERLTVDGKKLKFLVLGDANADALGKVVYTQKWIDRNAGGNVYLYYRKDYTTGTSPELHAWLDIPANSMSQSDNVSMTFDDSQNIGPTDIVFGPHGTTFSTPAILTIECKYFDLSGFDPYKLKLYYVNENGQWEEHPAHEIHVEPWWGFIRVFQAQIPHFSRYAIAAE
jgi:hypothetical protein